MADDYTMADDSQLDDYVQNASNDQYYSSDVQAAALADNNMDPDKIDEQDEDPVTSGNMQIGDLDIDEMEGQGSEFSYDEEAVPSGDNVIDN